MFKVGQLLFRKGCQKNSGRPCRPINAADCWLMMYGTMFLLLFSPFDSQLNANLGYEPNFRVDLPCTNLKTLCFDRYYSFRERIPAFPGGDRAVHSARLSLPLFLMQQYCHLANRKEHFIVEPYLKVLVRAIDITQKHHHNRICDGQHRRRPFPL